MNRIKRYVSHAPVLFIALAITLVALVIFVAYGYARFDFNFFDNFVATFIGVLLGFVVGLVANSIQTSEQNSAADQKETQHAGEILDRIKKELSANAEILSQRQALLEGNTLRTGGLDPSTLLQARLKVELWDALRAGGELAYITDLTLLEAIAAAYHQLRTIAILEEHRLTNWFTLGAGSSLEELADQERVLIPVAFQEIRDALEIIRKQPPSVVATSR